jgi:hypothetical protein
MGKEKCAGENENTHKFSVAHPERKRHFGISRPRRNIKDNVMNWTGKIPIPIAFRSVQYKFSHRPTSVLLMEQTCH